LPALMANLADSRATTSCSTADSFFGSDMRQHRGKFEIVG